jgi:hypothetical protein
MGRHLRKRHRDSAGERASTAKTHLLEGERREGAGALLAEPWVICYLISYYLSSEKLRAVE